VPDEAHALFQLDVGTDRTIPTDLDAVTNARTVGDARHRIAIYSSIRQVPTAPDRATSFAMPTSRDVVERGGSVKAITVSTASTSPNPLPQSRWSTCC
jgi:hypothetical protein